MSTVYPDYQWIPWKFKQTPKFFWHNTENCEKFIEWSEPFLNIKHKDDWQYVTHAVCEMLFLQINFRSKLRNWEDQGRKL
jgi:hypothetical protein